MDGAKIRELLLSSADAANSYSESGSRQPAQILGISVSIPLLGCENISIRVHEGGCLMTNILDTGKMFYIGEENTQAFIDYVLNECEGYEAVYVYEGDAGPALPAIEQGRSSMRIGPHTRKTALYPRLDLHFLTSHNKM